MKVMTMLDLDEYDILMRNMSTLQECSKDDSDSVNPQYMTYKKMQVINFDGVKTEYVASLGITENQPKSLDSLMVFDGKLTFVEFKNGSMKKEKDKVREKALVSLLIFNDIMGNDISYTRENVDMILVYNDEKNPSSKSKKTYVRESASRDYLKNAFLKKADEEFVRFQLWRLQRLYFHRVHTYRLEEFEKYLEAASE